jgi:hypothetical protein
MDASDEEPLDVMRSTQLQHVFYNTRGNNAAPSMLSNGRAQLGPESLVRD